MDVSRALRFLVPLSCKFAIRAGGFGTVPGIANIKGGVTLDLRGLNDVTLNNDNSTVEVGTGATWGAVYTQLQTASVTVAGSRAGSVGVGGSTLGGGFGYFAPKAGFAADQVIAFQVVLANGNIVTASATQNIALYKALKGGASNLGIVTRITFKTFAIGDIWGGDIFYNKTTIDAHAQALYDFTSNPSYDTNAGYLVSFVYNPSFGTIIASRLAYAEPTANPPVFQAITAIPEQLNDTTQITNVAALSNLSLSFSAAGYRQDNWDLTFENNVVWYKSLYGLFQNSLSGLKGVENVTWALTLEPIVPVINTQSQATGGNILGLDNTTLPGLALGVFSATWQSPDKDKQIYDASDKLLKKVTDVANKAKVLKQYVDVNYAGRKQNPIASFGPANYAFLKQVAKQVDPNGVFQKLVPGGFKL
ncbi:FAD-binding domain-containing protein [Trichoderma citrinoviride]|uniref:FAD-binding domain-containing protein n=1 Tax=Trichoderma citrinoviride TaxID=58853 RepID=A0A2T4BI46_9HYPO|nr:FAD-binding domain-containing protein [Trichoderma citrinoviride]PTB68948.1 FAD-binding domain-containing protein [Trichoderma citrinoviride]